MKFLLPASFITSLAFSSLQAGQLAGEIDYQVYRDFATNSGIYQAGAVDVPIYNQHTGDLIGVIPIVPDFSAASSIFPVGGGYYPKGSALAGGKQSWLTSSSHIGYHGKTVFLKDTSVAASSPIYDSYTSVATHHFNVDNFVSADITFSRLSKLATDAVGWDYAPSMSYSDLKDSMIMRIGIGVQTIIPPAGSSGNNSDLTGSGQHLTAGMVDIFPNVLSAVHNHMEDVKMPDGSTQSFLVRTIIYTQPTVSETNPLPIGALLGDSGTATIVYHEEDQQWYYMGALSGSTSQTTGVNLASSSFVSADWSASLLEYYQVGIAPTEQQWSLSLNASSGQVQLLGENSEQHIQALAAGLRGDTSTLGTRANSTQLNAAKDWVFSASTTLTLEDSINTGAGVLHFRTTEQGEATIYSLKASDSSKSLNSAGYLIEKDVVVKTNLLGAEGDEWRVTGDNMGAGTLSIEGTGNNAANINAGVGATVKLGHESGYSAHNIKINTDAVVILAQHNAFSGSLTFGQGGGALDTRGFDQNVAELHSLDNQGSIVNTSGESTLSLLIADSQYHGNILDSKAADQGKGVLNIRYAAQSNDNSLELTGKTDISGQFLIEKGHVHLQGESASLSAQTITVEKDASLSIDKSVNGFVQLAGTLNINGDASFDKIVLRKHHQLNITSADCAVQINDLILGDGAYLTVTDQISLTGSLTLRDVNIQVTRNRSAAGSVLLDSRLNNADLSTVQEITLVLSAETLAFLNESADSLDNIMFSGLSGHNTLSINFALNNAAGELVLPESWQGISYNSELGGANVSSIDMSVNAYDIAPEPSTVTLSLLALTGLLARRRRR